MIAGTIYSSSISLAIQNDIFLEEKAQFFVIATYDGRDYEMSSDSNGIIINNIPEKGTIQISYKIIFPETVYIRETETKKFVATTNKSPDDLVIVGGTPTGIDNEF